MARIVHLWTWTNNTWSGVATDVDITVGLRFLTEIPYWITQLRWFNSNPIPENMPIHLAIADLDTSEILHEVDDPSGDQLNGWIAIDLPEPLLLPAFHHYGILATFAAGGQYTVRPMTLTDTTVVPWVVFGVNDGLFTTDAWPALPTETMVDLIPYVDLSLQPDIVDTTGVTRRDLDYALDSWFTPTTATAPGNIGGWVPNQLQQIDSDVRNTWDILAELRGVGTETIGDVLTYLTTNLGTAEEWATSAHPKLVSWLAALLGAVADALAVLGFLHDLFPAGHTPTDHDASLAAHRAATEPEGETLPSYIEGEIEIVLSAVTDQTNEITQILAHGNGTEDVPTIVGESDWGNIFRFDVPADFYAVDITTTDVDATAEDVAGTQVWDHLGFCIPLTVDGLPEYGPRLAIGGQVIRTGRQMGGIILNGRRVLSGHVTAYKYQPA